MAQARLIVDDLLADKENSKFYHITSCTMLSKGPAPLQAADLMAYEMYKQMDNQIAQRTGRRIGCRSR